MNADIALRPRWAEQKAGAGWCSLKSMCSVSQREKRETLSVIVCSFLPPSLSPSLPSFLPCFLPSVLPSLSSYRLIIPNVLEICTSAPLGESVSCNQLSQALWQKRKEVLSVWVCGAAPFWDHRLKGLCDGAPGGAERPMCIFSLPSTTQDSWALSVLARGGRHLYG